MSGREVLLFASGACPSPLSHRRRAMRLTCQRCDGHGVVGPVHINRGHHPHTWGMVKCQSCSGSGYWTAQQAVAARNGEQMRRERIERGESLLKAARRLGMSPAQLSAIEHGRAALDAEGER